MSLPVNIDDYSLYLSQDSSELREQHVPDVTIQRVERLRELAAYWRSYPSTSSQELVNRCKQQFRVAQSQAYDDIHLLKILIGNLEATTREFARWRVNQMIEEDRAAARRVGDWRAVASMQKNYILNNQTNKPDTPDMAFDKIVPLQIEPTDDPSVLGIKAPKNLRQLRDKLIKQYSKDDYTSFAELPNDNEQQNS